MQKVVKFILIVTVLSFTIIMAMLTWEVRGQVLRSHRYDCDGYLPEVMQLVFPVCCNGVCESLYQYDDRLPWQPNLFGIYYYSKDE